jgi:hypothetical protein
MNVGRIYKIISDSTDKIYIGSTKKTLEERLYSHEECYQTWFNSDFKSHYCSSFEILKYGDYQIILLEEINCTGYQELLKLEGLYQINNYNSCVNIKISSKKPHIFTFVELNKYYICSCGKRIQNIYKTRRLHSKTPTHKSLLEKIHLNMVKDNKRFELIDCQSNVLLMD